ncbi:MAG: hypothetical protein AMJ84_00075 [Acidithiobacillales bacterium SM23_46]|nr:MAG: hypothetical protein AMJ84_00075 [Acidithiobacillales bacterium SM23_46]KPL28985.1 MAG: hypothetical protein AMJ72_00040 [Acidithiobacillales bacterium SM1_46]
MAYEKTRVFRIAGRQWRARKGLTINPRRKVYNDRGEWVRAWYAQPCDKSEEWRPVGRTLGDLTYWIQREESRHANP